MEEVKFEEVQESVKQDNGVVRTIGSKETEESPEEQQARVEEMKERIQLYAKQRARDSVIITFKTPIRQVTKELEAGKTIDGILEEIKNKKSSLSRATRDFCVNFKPEVILELVEDLKQRDLKKKNGTVKV